MLVSQLKLAEGLLIVFLGAVKVGAEDEEPSVEGMDFQALPDLQSALLNLPVDEVVLGLLVGLIDLGSDHLQEQLDLRVAPVSSVGPPELPVSLGNLQHAPKQKRPEHQQVAVPLLNHNAVLNLPQSKLSLVHLQISQSALQVVPKQRSLADPLHQPPVKLRVPLGKHLELRVLQNVLDAADAQQLKSLDLGYSLYLLEGRGRLVELVNSAVKETGAGEVHQPLVDLGQLV